MKLTLLYHHQMLNTPLHGTSPYGLYLHSYCPCLNLEFGLKATIKGIDMKLTLLYHHQILNTLLHGTPPCGLYLRSYCPCFNLHFGLKTISQ